MPGRFGNTVGFKTSTRITYHPMKLPRLSVRFILLSLAMATGAVAQAEPTLKGAGLGTPVLGPKITLADLKGKVVVFDYWGRNCGPCLAAIPHMVELQKKYDKKLVVVANHICQKGTTEEIAAAWKSHKGGEKISVVSNGKIAGLTSYGIPTVYVFDAKGKSVYEGQPGAEVDKAVEKAVKEMGGA